jgi:hypothetical protein
VVKRIAAALRLALIVTPLLSAGCNAILGIDEHELASPADGAADASTAGPDVRIDVDSGPAARPDGSTDAIGADVYAPPDRRDTDSHEGGSADPDAADAGATAPDGRDGGSMGSDGGDSGSVGDGGTSDGDGATIGRDGGDAGGRIVLSRGTISTIKLAPAAPGNTRLVDHGIAVPWKSCNASNRVSGGIAP